MWGLCKKGICSQSGQGTSSSALGAYHLADHLVLEGSGWEKMQEGSYSKLPWGNHNRAPGVLDQVMSSAAFAFLKNIL